MSIKIRRLSVSLVFMLSVLVLPFSNVQLASAATLSWDGSAGDGLFSTGANWSGDSAPIDGDTIDFTPLVSGTDYQSIYLVNDLAGVSFGGLTTTTSASGYTKYFHIDTITFKDGATVTSSGTDSKNAYVYYGVSGDGYGGTVNGEGSMSSNGNLGGVLNITGNLTAVRADLVTGSTIGGNLTTKAGSMPSNTVVGGAITLTDLGRGFGIKGASATIANTFNVGSFDSDYVLNQLAFGNCSVEPGGGGAGGGAEPVIVACDTYAPATFILSGTINLTSNLVIHVASQSTVKLTGTINYNGHTITKEASSGGTLEVGGLAVVVPTVSTDLGGSNPSTDVSIVNQETATLSGERRTISVQSGGILKGTGTADMVFVYGGGIIAPGNSPGKLTITTSLILGGTYQAEILNKDTYDKIQAGDVTLNTGAILSTILYSGYSINNGEQFMIVENTGSSSVSGTFTGLPEGTQFTVGNVTFSITYVGGTGNDIVLTALNTGSDPNAPNTAVANFIKANPFAVIALGIITAGFFTFLAIRHKSNK